MKNWKKAILLAALGIPAASTAYAAYKEFKDYEPEYEADPLTGPNTSMSTIGPYGPIAIPEGSPYALMVPTSPLGSSTGAGQEQTLAYSIGSTVSNVLGDENVREFVSTLLEPRLSVARSAMKVASRKLKKNSSKSDQIKEKAIKYLFKIRSQPKEEKEEVFYRPSKRARLS